MSRYLLRRLLIERPTLTCLVTTVTVTSSGAEVVVGNGGALQPVNGSYFQTVNPPSISTATATSSG